MTIVGPLLLPAVSGCGARQDTWPRLGARRAHGRGRHLECHRFVRRRDLILLWPSVDAQYTGSTGRTGAARGRVLEREHERNLSIRPQDAGGLEQDPAATEVHRHARSPVDADFKGNRVSARSPALCCQGKLLCRHNSPAGSFCQ